MADSSKFEVDLKPYYHKMNGQDLLMPGKDFPSECLDLFKDFQFRKGDCLCATYPKMGELKFLIFVLVLIPPMSHLSHGFL